MRKKIVSVLLVAGMLAGLCACGTKEAGRDLEKEGWKLIFSDEFDGETLDTTKWDYQFGDGSQYGLNGWGNAELQFYTNRTENVRVEDGKLCITATKEKIGGGFEIYTSGRIRTITEEGEALFSTTYGRVEARMKLPAGDGLWPAFWMLPVDTGIYGRWAASGEIDVMEARGRQPQLIDGTLHYGGIAPKNAYAGGHYEFPEGQDFTEYHVYAVEWEEDEFRWYVDDVCYYTTNEWYSSGAEEGNKTAPFDVPFYILFNMAVGGNYDAGANPDNAEFPATMEVDYVRVYQK